MVSQGLYQLFDVQQCNVVLLRKDSGLCLGACELIADYRQLQRELQELLLLNVGGLDLLGLVDQDVYDLSQVVVVESALRDFEVRDKVILQDVSDPPAAFVLYVALDQVVLLALAVFKFPNSLLPELISYLRRVCLLLKGEYLIRNVSQLQDHLFATDSSVFPASYLQVLEEFVEPFQLQLNLLVQVFNFLLQEFLLPLFADHLVDVFPLGVVRFPELPVL